MKNMKNKLNEPVLAVITLLSLGVLYFTKEVSMSDMTSFSLVTVFVLGVVGYGIYIWQENPADEREQELLMVASKHAYLVSSFVLGIGIVVQSINHELDVWLIAALGSTVMIKLISYFIHRRRQE